jgi:hypothetical protein
LVCITELAAVGPKLTVPVAKALLEESGEISGLADDA